MIHEGVLRYRRFRFLWIAIALMVVSTLIYVSQGGSPRARGDTWQGYTLGTVAALLILWLTSLGIRKRRYRSALGSVQGWTSAHIYLGLALVLVATLHCAAEFHLNVHTVSYVLMCIVVASGIMGLIAYNSLPRQQAAGRSGSSRGALFADLFKLDKEITNLAKACDPEVAAAVLSSVARTRLGGGVTAQLTGLDSSMFENPNNKALDGTSKLVRNTDQKAVLACVAARLPRGYRQSETEALEVLVVALARRQMVLRRIRRDIQLQGWLRLWLYVHIPLTIATVAALIAHILSEFAYF